MIGWVFFQTGPGPGWDGGREYIGREVFFFFFFCVFFYIYEDMGWTMKEGSVVWWVGEEGKAKGGLKAFEGR